jgi:NAD(P)H dehydrogenase (quinone)
MSTSTKPTVAVTGASGQLGRRVVDLLLDSNAGKVVGITRTPDKLADLADRGAEIRKGDFDHPKELERAFDGVDRVLIVSTDALGHPKGRHAHHADAVKAAEAAGVTHAAYTSYIGPRPTTALSVSNDHFQTELAIAQSRMTWTFLRNNMYTDVLLWGLPQAVASGTLYTATGGRGRSYVTREDCARAAVGALLSDFEGHRILDITGPAAVTQDEIAAIASEIAGKSVKHVALTRADMKKGMIASGMPEMLAEVMLEFDTMTAEGYLAVVTPTVKDLTGREPTSVREYLSANRDALLQAQAA